MALAFGWTLTSLIKDTPIHAVVWYAAIPVEWSHDPFQSMRLFSHTVVDHRRKSWESKNARAGGDVRPSWNLCLHNYSSWQKPQHLLNMHECVLTSCHTLWPTVLFAFSIAFATFRARKDISATLSVNGDSKKTLFCLDAQFSATRMFCHLIKKGGFKFWHIKSRFSENIYFRVSTRSLFKQCTLDSWKGEWKNGPWNIFLQLGARRSYYDVRKSVNISQGGQPFWLKF